MKTPATMVTYVAMLLGVIGFSTTSSHAIATAIVYGIAAIVAVHSAVKAWEKHSAITAAVKVRQAQADMALAASASSAVVAAEAARRAGQMQAS